jgi:hypothetical protein
MVMEIAVRLGNVGEVDSNEVHEFAGTAAAETYLDIVVVPIVFVRRSGNFGNIVP